jgi:hypothetical protein
MKFAIQFNESPTDDRVEAAREGATSDIMMNGTGPRPTAKDITKVRIAILETIVMPVFKP